ncbi:MAG: D,D-dipeptide ABC transporter permease, partial [Gammaproteobacteria bacterium]|nr:D,D-dipeptide ABC transporter permease [Gammaproteobacteria bacterium]
MPAEATLRGWLLAEIPKSKIQARCQRVFIGWLDFKRNPIAMIGLLIVVGLVVIAALAPWITA